MDYFWIINAVPGWDEKLESYDVNVLLLDPNEQQVLIEELEISDYWYLAYQDKGAQLYIPDE